MIIKNKQLVNMTTDTLYNIFKLSNVIPAVNDELNKITKIIINDVIKYYDNLNFVYDPTNQDHMNEFKKCIYNCIIINNTSKTRKLTIIEEMIAHEILILLIRLYPENLNKKDELIDIIVKNNFMEIIKDKHLNNLNLDKYYTISNNCRDKISSLLLLNNDIHSKSIYNTVLDDVSTNDIIINTVVNEYDHYPSINNVLGYIGVDGANIIGIVTLEHYKLYNHTFKFDNIFDYNIAMHTIEKKSYTKLEIENYVENVIGYDYKDYLETDYENPFDKLDDYDKKYGFDHYEFNLMQLIETFIRKTKIRQFMSKYNADLTANKYVAKHGGPDFKYLMSYKPDNASDERVICYIGDDDIIKTHTVYNDSGLKNIERCGLCRLIVTNLEGHYDKIPNFFNDSTVLKEKIYHAVKLLCNNDLSKITELSFSDIVSEINNDLEVRLRTGNLSKYITISRQLNNVELIKSLDTDKINYINLDIEYRYTNSNVNLKTVIDTYKDSILEFVLSRAKDRPEFEYYKISLYDIYLIGCISIDNKSTLRFQFGVNN